MKIRNKKTGEIIEVADDQLGEYGITPAEPQQAPQQGGLNISPEQAMMAQILFPGSKGGDMIKSAYDIQRQSQQDMEKVKEKELKAAEDDKRMKGFVDVAQDLKQNTRDVNVLNAPLQAIIGKFGVDTDLKAFDRKKATVSQFLAKMVENNRLSDADRTFYQEKIMNVSPYGPQGAKDKAIDEIITDVVRLTGEDPAQFGLNQQEDKKKETSGASLDNPNLQNILNNPILQGFAKFGQNAQTDTQGIVEGLKQFPGMAAQYSVPVMALNTLRGEGEYLHPKNVAETTYQVGKGVVEPYYNLATSPIETIKEKPATSFLSLLPFLQAARGAGATKASGVVDDAIRTSKPMSAIDDISRVDDIATSKVTGPSKASEAVSNASARVYNQQFTVPRKIAYRLKPLDTSKKILEYGFKPTDLLGTKAIAESVTGSNGVLTKITRDAVSKTTTPIKIDATLKVINNAGERFPAIDDAALAKHTKTIKTIVENNQDAGIFQMRPDTAMQSVRDLEKMGYQFKNASTDMSPNVANQQIGQLYLDAADELSLQIDKASGTENVVKAMQTPENYKALYDISPKLADEFMAAKNIKDLRSLQAPFVKLGQMVDITEAASTTPFSNLSKGASKVVGAGTGGVLGGPVGAMAGYLASPLLESILEPLMPRVQQGLANQLYKVGQSPLIKGR